MLLYLIWKALIARAKMPVVVNDCWSILIDDHKRQPTRPRRPRSSP